MSSGRCRKHGMYLVPPMGECPACDAYVADIRRIARTPLCGPLCRRCGQSVMDWRRHKAFHEAEGGTYQFDIANCDRLMSA